MVGPKRSNAKQPELSAWRQHHSYSSPTLLTVGWGHSSLRNGLSRLLHPPVTSSIQTAVISPKFPIFHCREIPLHPLFSPAATLRNTNIPFWHSQFLGSPSTPVTARHLRHCKQVIETFNQECVQKRWADSAAGFQTMVRLRNGF